MVLQKFTKNKKYIHYIYEKSIKKLNIIQLMVSEVREKQAVIKRVQGSCVVLTSEKALQGIRFSVDVQVT